MIFVAIVSLTHSVSEDLGDLPRVLRGHVADGVHEAPPEHPRSPARVRAEPEAVAIVHSFLPVDASRSVRRGFLFEAACFAKP